jgi:hypothetical protein
MGGEALWLTKIVCYQKFLKVQRESKKGQEWGIIYKSKKNLIAGESLKSKKKWVSFFFFHSAYAYSCLSTAVALLAELSYTSV